MSYLPSCSFLLLPHAVAECTPPAQPPPSLQLDRLDSAIADARRAISMHLQMARAGAVLTQRSKMLTPPSCPETSVDGTTISPRGSPVVAQLRTSSNNSEIWNLVEIRVQGRKVGFLSSGDASRFRRRLAFERHAGQTTSCDALIPLSGSHCAI